MKQRGIKHPLSHIFTAEEFHYQKAEMAVLFKNCYVNDRFYYPSVQWDIRRNILRFNRKNGNRDIKCVKLSIFNCDKEQEIIDPIESRLFIDTCKNFFNDLKVKYTNNIKHLELRKFKTNPKIIKKMLQDLELWLQKTGYSSTNEEVAAEAVAIEEEIEVENE